MCRFLLARLTFDTLIGHKTLKAIKDTLAKLSRGAASLDSAYDDAMKRIEDQDSDGRDLAKKTLLWISQGQRPLTVHEMQQAVAIELGESDLDPESMVVCDDIISACTGLVTRGRDSRGDDVFRLVHYTTQEYLERTKAKYSPEAQKYLASSCLTYLLFDVFSGALCTVGDTGTEDRDEATGLFCFGCKNCWNAEQHEREKIDSSKGWRSRTHPCSLLRSALYPFYEYAVFYWGYHTEKCDDEAIRILTKTLLDDTLRVSGAFRYVVKKCDVVKKSHLYWSMHLKLQDSNPASAMLLAAFLGLTKLVSKRLEDGSEPDVKDKDGRTPLFWAVIRGHEDVVKLLMRRDNVDPNVRDQKGETPLIIAVNKGDIEMVKLLLAYEYIEINAKDEDLSLPPLFHAINQQAKNLRQQQDRQRREPLQILKLLLACDNIKVNVEDGRGRTPLMKVAWCEDTEGMRALLAHGNIQVNAKDDEDDTALYIAASRNWAEGLRLLLAREDIQVNVKNDRGTTSLYVAVNRQSLKAMRLLLAREDIQVNVKDNNGQTALHEATKYGSAMQLLLAREDIQVNVKDNKGQTPLHKAAKCLSFGTVQLLLAREDIQVNTMDDEGETALHNAAKRLGFKTVQLLLARDDLEVNATDYNGESALISAIKAFCFRGAPYLGVVELFLSREDVHLNMRDMDGCTPLYHAVRSGRPDVVQLLLTREDLKISIKDGEGERLVSLAEDEWDKAEGKDAMDDYDRIIDLLRSYIQRKLQLYAHLAYLDLAF